MSNSEHPGQQPLESAASSSHKKPTRHKHIDFLPLKRQRELRDREQIIKDCIALKDANNGRLPRGEGSTAMKKLRIKSRQTLLNLIERYERHQRQHPDEPAVNALIQRWGRPSSTALTLDEEKVALGLYLTTDWESVLEPEKDGDKPPVYHIKMRPRVDFIYKILSEVFPELNATEDQLWHFLERKRQDDGVLFTLARYGEKQVWMEYIPKTSNDVEAPNDRWQSDGRALPLVVRDDKDPSLTFTVTQVIVLDDFSRYVPAWTLVPRKERTHTKKTRRVGVKGADVRLVMATALRITGYRPFTLYTDNGSEYEAFEPHLKYLTDDNEPSIQMVFSKPGHPWGRGKVEVIGALIDDFLRGLPGFVVDEDDLRCWDQAHAAPNLLTFSEFKIQIAAYWNKKWNTTAASGKKSRKQIYDESPQSSLRAPSLIRLAHLGLAQEWAEVSISDNGLYYRGEYYKPSKQDKESTYRWLNAAGRASKVPLYVLPLVEGDDVGEKKLVIASLDGNTWEEVIPIKSRLPSAKKHVENQRSALKRKKQELGAIFGDLQAILNEKYASKPQLHALTGAPIIHRRDAEEQNDPILGSPPAGDADTPLDIDAAGEKAPQAPDNRPILEPTDAPLRPTRGRRTRVDNNAEAAGQAPNMTSLAPPPTPPPEQPAVQDDDDAKVRERLRLLRAQRQQDTHS